MTKRFSTGDAFRFGWEVFKGNWILLLEALVVLMLVQLLVNGLTMIAGDNLVIQVLVAVVSIVLSLGLQLGLIKITLGLHDYHIGSGIEPKLADIASAFDKIIPYLIGSIIYGLAAALGFALLILPGIYIVLTYQFYSYLIVDKDLGAIDALRRSGEITKGCKWELLLLFVLSIVLNIIGALALLVGLLITVPVTMVAFAYVYRKLEAIPSVMSENVTASGIPSSGVAD